jgi:M6 family metalloprotease-like protein
MNLARVGANDSTAYYDSLGHWVDPPPHNSDYFNSHMKALRVYYETVSQNRVTVKWDIWPRTTDSTYTLPLSMDRYGICYQGLPGDVAFDSIIYGLEQYFLDCFRLADTASPDIDFAQYDSYFLFHAGSDQQNDIGFPTTCSDLFTGFISYRDDDTLLVDHDSTQIVDALILPETASQDNRATALNAVIAHEFGHQLGLVDLYTTNSFITCLGDFALMDHNGFGTAVDLGYDVGRVFGAFPVFPSAWSRAYLGFVEVYDFREGTDLRIVAAEVVSSGIKVARVPISENEYYLIENRVVNPDNRSTGLKADSNWVFLYPADEATGEPTGEYDFLLPGSGLAIYHVDEGVTVLDYDGDGTNNFDDNTLQWDPHRKFVALVEADGVVDMSGYYEFGPRRYGWEEDLFREDRLNSLTPNTNPPAIDNSGNNTRVRVTDIRRATEFIGGIPNKVDTLITFDLETERLADGFPVRGGYPDLQVYGFSPIVDDLDRDGNPEIVFTYDNRVLVTTSGGGNFLHEYNQCSPCVTFYDSAKASVHPGRLHPLPLFFETVGPVLANPVTGDFGDSESNKYLAIGYSSSVTLARLDDANNNGLADPAAPPINLGSEHPLAMTFGDRLTVLTDGGRVIVKDSLSASSRVAADLDEDEYYGLVRLGTGLVVVGGDTVVSGQAPYTRLYYLDLTGADYGQDDLADGSLEIEGRYEYGPVMADFNRDNLQDIALFSAEGDGVLISIDLALFEPPIPVPVYSVVAVRDREWEFEINPAVGDVDNDGYPDVIIGGPNAVYAFNHQLTLKTGFPIEVNDRFPDDDIIAAPIVADLQNGGMAEIAFPSLVGNIDALGPEMVYGFPVSAGEIGLGSPVYWTDSIGGKIGYQGSDGWFYAWEVDLDSTTAYWPMYGQDASGSFRLPSDQLPAPAEFEPGFDERKFFAYPNPVTTGMTTIRYFLSRPAERVQLRIYDLSGEEIAVLDGPLSGDTDNETIWQCGNVTPGVYRCIIEVDSGANTETAFTDIAIIR